MAGSRRIGGERHWPLAAATGLVASLLAITSGAAPGAGFAPSERILPATTRAWASASDAPALRARFERSALGRLLDEPLMQPFYDSLEEKRSSVAGDRLGFGITAAELSSVSGGETAVAAVEREPGKIDGALLVDTTGHDDAVAPLMETVISRLEGKGAKPIAAPEGIRAFEVPPPAAKEGEAEPGKPRRLAFATVPGALLAGTGPEIVAALLPALGDGRDDSLASLEAFRAIMEKVGATAPEGVPCGRWFVDPLAYADAQLQSRPAPKKPSKRKPTNYVEMAQIGRAHV